MKQHSVWRLWDSKPDEGSELIEIAGCHAERETELRLFVCTQDERRTWIPKNEIDDDSEVYAAGTSGVLIVPRWLAEERNLLRRPRRRVGPPRGGQSRAGGTAVAGDASTPAPAAGAKQAPTRGGQGAQPRPRNPGGPPRSHRSHGARTISPRQRGTSNRAAASRETSFIEPTTRMHLLWIPGGRFFMGADDISGDERPSHLVSISGFWLAETPVTNRQYQRFIDATGHAVPDCWRTRRWNRPEQPVVGVTWHDANRFCRWLSEVSGHHIALPTEAQWEFAARGEECRRFPWGDEAPNKQRAHYGHRLSDGHPIAVGGLPDGRGPFGTLDQAGNVWEWCCDLWDGKAYRKRGALTQDPSATVEHNRDCVSSRVIRGGAFTSIVLDLQAAYRYWWAADQGSFCIGFRVGAYRR